MNYVWFDVAKVITFKLKYNPQLQSDTCGTKLGIAYSHIPDS